MGRKKKQNLHRFWKSEKARRKAELMASNKPDEMSLEEFAFRESARIMEYAIPYSLNHWRQYFTTEARFLVAAQEWLNQRMDGVRYPRIEDDVDKGLMRRGGHQSKPWSWEDENQDWEGQFMGAGQHGPSKWWNRKLDPVTPTIPAPAGMSNVDMETVFLKSERVYS